MSTKHKRGAFWARRIHVRLRIAACWLPLALSLAIIGLAPASTRAEGAPSKEYQVKAAFLLNFAQFVEWPDGALTNSSAPFCIGILGDDPFGPAMEATIQGENVHGHKLAIVRSRRIEDLKNCQLIFISKSEKGRLAEILGHINARQKLTVGDVEGFARAGGIIDFYVEGNKVRFEINPGCARREGLKLSSQLLSLGRIVESTSAGDGH